MTSMPAGTLSFFAYDVVRAFEQGHFPVMFFGVTRGSIRSIPLTLIDLQEGGILQVETLVWVFCSFDSVFQS